MNKTMKTNFLYEYVPIGENFEVPLGVDSNIIVERKADKIHTGTSGYIIKTNMKVRLVLKTLKKC